MVALLSASSWPSCGVFPTSSVLLSNCCCTNDCCDTEEEDLVTLLGAGIADAEEAEEE